MTDTTVTTEAPKPIEAPLANSSEARQTDGTLKDQTQTTTPSAESTEPKPTDKPASGAPETYAAFTAPEGQTLNADLVKEATGLFKELNLTQDQAQKLVDFYGKDVIAKNGAPQKAFDTMVDGWYKDTVANPDLGANGEVRKDVIENIGRLKATLGNADKINAFNEIMNLSGLGNHPVMVAALNSWSKLVVEGKHVQGNGPSSEGQKAPGAPERPSVAKAMYPNLPG